MSADLGPDALDGVGHLITDTVSVGLNSLSRMAGGLESRLHRGEQPLPALWALNRVQEVDESATDDSGSDKLWSDRSGADLDRKPKPILCGHCLGHAAGQWPGGLSCLWRPPDQLASR